MPKATNSSGLKTVFEHLCFRDGLEWTEDQTVEIKLLFKFPRGSVDGGGGLLIITCQSRWERNLKPFARAQIKAKRSVFRYCIRFLRWNSVKLGRLVRNTLLTRLSGRSIGRIFHRGKSKRFTKIGKNCLITYFERFDTEIIMKQHFIIVYLIILRGLVEKRMCKQYSKRTTRNAVNDLPYGDTQAESCIALI